jgi:hypothetical protein
MQQILDPVLRNLLLGLLALTRCSYFSIDPQHKRILISDNFKNDDIPIITTNEILNEHHLSFEFERLIWSPEGRFWSLVVVCMIMSISLLMYCFITFITEAQTTLDDGSESTQMELA